MMLTASALLLGPGIGAVPSRLWEHQGSSPCVPIPSNMALCQGLGYNSMRIPNLLGHESPAEAVQQSTSWLPLLARECHPNARIFLCSPFSPVCLERIISPCRSVCVSVRDTCAPIMNCHGYPWPRILQCDQFPKDHLMCISSVAYMQNSTNNLNNLKLLMLNSLLMSLSLSLLVVKVRLSKLNSSSSVLTMFSLGSRLEVLKHGPLLGGELRSRLTLWLERDATCVGNLTHNHPDVFIMLKIIENPCTIFLNLKILNFLKCFSETRVHCAFSVTNFEVTFTAVICRNQNLQLIYKNESTAETGNSPNSSGFKLRVRMLCVRSGTRETLCTCPT
uniref:FZ domain-containing protein n=1 Tax=Cyprinus carpio carpio TaxID=630221 RepID=A0A8C1CBC7_CYPCA